MNYRSAISIIYNLVILGSIQTFGFSVSRITGQFNPFGHCEVFQLGDAKRSTESHEFFDESLLAFYPVQDAADGLSIEVHVEETIFRLTLTRKAISLDKCSHVTKRCTVEQETQIERIDYIIYRKWNIVKLLVHSQQLSIQIGPQMVFTTSMIGYPHHSRMSWLVKYKQASDYDAKKRLALYGNQTIYSVQFQCEEYDANDLLSSTELASSTESTNFISYGKDRNDDELAETDLEPELWETTLGFKTTSLPTASSISTEPSYRIVLNTETYEEEYYDEFLTTPNPTTEFTTPKGYFHQAEFSEQNDLTPSSTTPEFVEFEKEEVSTTMDSTTPDASLISQYSTQPVYLDNFGISVSIRKDEEYGDSTSKSYEEILTTTPFSTAKTLTDKPEQQKKKFDNFYVVLIAGSLAGVFIVFAVIIYCVVRRRRFEPTTENFSPEVQTNNVK